MKFSEYLSSYITPQMTLLEKFNAMCKWLDEHEEGFGTKLYKHHLTLNNGNHLYVVNTNSEKETSLDYNTFRKSVSVHYMLDQEVIKWTRNFEYDNVISVYNGTTITNVNIGQVIVSDEVTEL